MKFSFIYFLALLMLLFNTVAAQTAVKGYYRKDGTYVRPYSRSTSTASNNRDNNKLNTASNEPGVTRTTRNNASTFMDNYHKVYQGNHSNVRYQNYNTLLRHNSYSKLVAGAPSTVTNNQGTAIGYLYYDASGRFKILDSDSIHIGYIQLSGNGRTARIYDSYGYHVVTKTIQP